MFKKCSLLDITKETSKDVVDTTFNIDSLRNKFELLKDVIILNVDVLIIPETKLDKSFPIGHLKFLDMQHIFK